jgi:tyrosinase
MDVRKNIKDLSAADITRFIEAVRWVKLHNRDGSASTQGGMYQKFIDWHSAPAPVNLAKLNNYSLAVTDPFVASDTITQIRIDGRDVTLTAPAPSITDPSAVGTALNTLVAHGDSATFAVFNSTSASSDFRIACSNSPFIIESARLTVGGAARTVPFTKGPDIGDFSLAVQNIAHGNPLFLPWHRVFVRFLELDLQHADRQRGNDGKIAVPYWNWDNDRSETFKLWTDAIAGPFSTEADGRMTSGFFRAKNAAPPGDWVIYRLSGGAISEAAPNYLMRHVKGAPASPIPPNAVDFLMGFAEYDSPPFDTSAQFRSNLEDIHGDVHVWIGGRDGHMRNVAVSPNDIVFFMHHCNVDRIWSRWQRDHRRANQYPPFGLLPGLRKADLMEPWKSLPAGNDYKVNVSASHVLNWQNFDPSVNAKLGTGYKYDCESSITLSSP